MRHSSNRRIFIAHVFLAVVTVQFTFVIFVDTYQTFPTLLSCWNSCLFMYFPFCSLYCTEHFIVWHRLASSRSTSFHYWTWTSRVIYAFFNATVSFSLEIYTGDFTNSLTPSRIITNESRGKDFSNDLTKLHYLLCIVLLLHEVIYYTYVTSTWQIFLLFSNFIYLRNQLPFTIHRKFVCSSRIIYSQIW